VSGGPGVSTDQLLGAAKNDLSDRGIQTLFFTTSCIRESDDLREFRISRRRFPR